MGAIRKGLLGLALAVGLTAAAVPATAHASPAHAAGPRVAATCTPVSPTSIWSGYEACGQTFTSVTATWTQPRVSCTSTGTVGFWVGLGGIAGSTLIQTGVNVSCASGSPQYTGFWEVTPAAANSYAYPVYPGDTMTATVVDTGSDTYSLQLTDVTRDWGETTPVNAIATDQSAEIITEAVTVGGQTTVLPNFTAVQFINTAIDGASLQTSAAAQVTMVNGDDQVIAYPSSLSGSGFIDFYAGWVGSAVAAALTGSNGYLYTYSAPGLNNTVDPVQLGTSPAIAQLSNGSYEIAYQSSSGYLTVFNSGTVTNTGLPMKSGTSPAIAASPFGGYQVAYQSNTGSMWIYTPSTGGVNQSQGMLAGTSPAITALSGGGYEMAFQANTGILILYGSGGNNNTGLGMKAGTSPAISSVAGGGFESAFQANTGVLWTFGTNGTANLGLGMASGTSPAIAGLTTGGYELAFQTNTGVLEVYGSAADLNTGIGMATGTSPAITAVAGGGYETAIQENTHDFAVWGTAGNVATNLIMDSGTSPSVSV
ncbi:MAG TPA: G1 family glutamic endopeptidase [Streptosporangiaceae bacterium]